MKHSSRLWMRACELIPGGVNSPVRAFGRVGGRPLFIARGKGPHIYDREGSRYIDYVGSWGPLILGHDSPVVRSAVEEALRLGTSFGAPTEREVEFAEIIVSLVPGVEMVRLMSSGTEAAMTAVRLARGVTGRSVIVKFDGCYHGHSDCLLVKAGSGLATAGEADSAGIPAETAAATVSLEFNDLGLATRTIEAVGPERIAAVIVEPLPANMGLVPPEEGFLQGLRRLCTRWGIVLIFDEVISGFRLGLKGAAGYYGVTADLTVMGKIIGGGLPLGAVGGARSLMEHLAPSGPVYQAGTLSGNPLAVSAGLAALKHLRDTSPYPRLAELGLRWQEGMNAAARRAGLAVQALSCGSILGLFFSEQPVRCYSDVLKTDTDRFSRYFHGMLERGIYLAPSPFEVGFLCTEHDEDLIDCTIAAAEEVFLNHL